MMDNNKIKVVCVIGTRPEAIKMVPVIRALELADWANCIVVATAQHRDLLDQMLDKFKIRVDHDLDIMLEAQQTNSVLARILPPLDAIIENERANALLAQGDTATVLAAAIAAFNRKIPFGHVEAGLRTYNLGQPYPEEGYRQMVSRIASWHFAPTEGAAKALRAEGIMPERICVSGNTCIDTLLQTVIEVGAPTNKLEKIILVTTHRRESFGAPMDGIFNAIRTIADMYPDLKIIFPIHPNPVVRKAASSILAQHSRIQIVQPMDYFDFVRMMQRATMILTDSGGIQEEAPALGKPVLVLREVTERPEAIACGSAMLVGTDTANIVAAVSGLLNNKSNLQHMAHVRFPYGDGKAASRIIETIRSSFH